jgi:hypothetical protein
VGDAEEDYQEVKALEWGTPHSKGPVPAEFDYGKDLRAAAEILRHVRVPLMN